MIKWTKISGLEHVVKWVRTNSSFHNIVPPKIIFNSKIKLHGTNAGVRVHVNTGEVFAQSRNRTLSFHDDNAGFAKWVSANEDFFRDILSSEHLPKKDFSKIVVFGEWCGKGIMKGVSIASLDRKIFAVFSILLYLSDEKMWVLVEPEALSKIIGEHEDVYVLPWHSTVDIDFSDKESMRESVENINSYVEEIEVSDPWVEKTFNLEGPGEGLVWYPVICENPNEEGIHVDRNILDEETLSRLIFKTKGEKHRVKKSKAPAAVDLELAKDIEDFVEKFVTEARLEQALQESCNGDTSKQNIGKFLKWIGNDIKSESQEEVESLECDWRNLAKAISNKSRMWFLKKSEESIFS